MKVFACDRIPVEMTPLDATVSPWLFVVVATAKTNWNCL